MVPDAPGQPLANYSPLSPAAPDAVSLGVNYVPAAPEQVVPGSGFSAVVAGTLAYDGTPVVFPSMPFAGMYGDFRTFESGTYSITVVGDALTLADSASGATWESPSSSYTSPEQIPEGDWEAAALTTGDPVVTLSGIAPAQAPASVAPAAPGNAPAAPGSVTPVDPGEVAPTDAVRYVPQPARTPAEKAIARGNIGVLAGLSGGAVPDGVTGVKATGGFYFEIHEPDLTTVLAAGDSITIGGRTYGLVDAAPGPDQIVVTSTMETFIPKLVTAINDGGVDGVATPHADVTATGTVMGDYGELALEARESGVAGDAVAMAAVSTNYWIYADVEFLYGGVDEVPAVVAEEGGVYERLDDSGALAGAYTMRSGTWVETMALLRGTADPNGTSTSAYLDISMTAAPVVGDQFIVDGETYTFVTWVEATAVNGDVALPANADTARTHLISAINDGMRFIPTGYKKNKVAGQHPTVTADDFTTGSLRLLARAAGTAGNGLEVSATGSWTDLSPGAALAGGADGLPEIAAPIGSRYVQVSATGAPVAEWARTTGGWELIPAVDVAAVAADLAESPATYRGLLRGGAGHDSEAAWKLPSDIRLKAHKANMRGGFPRLRMLEFQTGLAALSQDANLKEALFLPADFDRAPRPVSWPTGTLGTAIPATVRRDTHCASLVNGTDTVELGFSTARTATTFTLLVFFSGDGVTKTTADIFRLSATAAPDNYICMRNPDGAVTNAQIAARVVGQTETTSAAIAVYNTDGARCYAIQWTNGTGFSWSVDGAAWTAVAYPHNLAGVVDKLVLGPHVGGFSAAMLFSSAVAMTSQQLADVYQLARRTVCSAFVRLVSDGDSIMQQSSTSPGWLLQALRSQGWLHGLGVYHKLNTSGKLAKTMFTKAVTNNGFAAYTPSLTYPNCWLVLHGGMNDLADSVVAASTSGEAVLGYLLGICKRAKELGFEKVVLGTVILGKTILGYGRRSDILWVNTQIRQRLHPDMRYVDVILDWDLALEEKRILSYPTAATYCESSALLADGVHLGSVGVALLKSKFLATDDAQLPMTRESM